MNFTTQSLFENQSQSAAVGDSAPSSIAITSCQNISQSGTYSLANNINSSATSATSSAACLTIRNTQDVFLNCNNHFVTSVSGSYALRISNVKHFSVDSCNFRSSSISGNPLQALVIIRNSSNGKIEHSATNGKLFSVNSSGDLNFQNNNFASYYQLSSHRITFENNTLGISSQVARSELPATLIISSQSGSNNTFSDNHILGGSDSVFANRNGADDGIFIQDETGDTVTNNTIENVYDCGIETEGYIGNSQFQGNKIKNAGFCGIGGWYYSSWKDNSVSSNTINNTPRMFVFFREYGLSPRLASSTLDSRVYFQNNNFTGNNFINPRAETVGGFPLVASAITIQSTGPAPNSDEKPVTDSDIVVGNNVFTGNNFNTFMTVPLFIPQRLVVDGGRNICAKIRDNDPYPLKCAKALNAQNSFDSSGKVLPTNLAADDCVQLTHVLTLGSQDSNTNGEVTLFQHFLNRTNYSKSNATGYFGEQTLMASKKFETDHKAQNASGIVWPSVAGIIANLSCN